MTLLEANRTASLLPDVLVVLGAGISLRSALELTIGREINLRFADSIDECVAIARRFASVGVLVTVPQIADADVLTHVGDVRSQFPNALFCSLYVGGESNLAALAALSEVGIKQTLDCSRLDSANHWKHVLSAGVASSRSQRLWQQAGIAVSTELATLMLVALRHAHAPISMARLGLAAQMHERTLRKYCDRHALPSPQWLIGWSRCLLAAYYLEEDGRTIHSVSQLMQYKSSSLLANHLRRYTGHSATELRRSGPLQMTARGFEQFAREWRPQSVARLTSSPL